MAEPGRTDEPLVVGLVPTWRAETFIDATLKSLAAQTYHNLRFIISDDASTDRTVEICEQFIESDGRFTLIKRDRNVGFVRNLNSLIEAARGDYVFIGYHDDLFDPNFVEHLVSAVVDHPDAIGAFPDYHYWSHKGHDERASYPVLDGVHDPAERVSRVLSHGRFSSLPHRGLLKLDAIRRIGGLPLHLAGERGADGLWVIRMVAVGEIVRVPEVLIHKYKRKDGLSSTWTKGPWSDFAWHLSCAGTVAAADLRTIEKLNLLVQISRRYAMTVKRRLRRP